MNKNLVFTIFATMLLAGCVEMEQELNRDGTSEFIMEVILDLPPMMQDEIDDNQFEDVKSDLMEEFVMITVRK